MTKDYLPHHALIESGRSSTRPKVSKCIPMIGLFIIFMGSAFIGFSAVVVPTNHVGFYPCTSCSDIKTYNAGIYLEFPWKKGDLKIANVADGNLTLGNVSYTRNDTKLYTGFIGIGHQVKNVNLYLRTLSMFKSITLFESTMAQDVKNRVTNQYEMDTFGPFNLYGLKFDNIYTIS